MLEQILFNSQTPLTPYAKAVWRVVESQESAATLNVVDDVGEQDVLERLLDEVKPVYRKGTEHMHYLLKTAFRYPPLKYGSRFGTIDMPSYFYASELISTALCESAYYRFVFLQDMFEPYNEAIRSEFCAFQVSLSAPDCLDLQDESFNTIQSKLTDPRYYSYKQSIGRWAQQDNIAIIRFASARVNTASPAFNVAVSEPQAIKSRKPRQMQAWQCLTNQQTVSFSSRESKKSYRFDLQQFCQEGEFLRAG